MKGRTRLIYILVFFTLVFLCWVLNMSDNHQILELYNDFMLSNHYSLSSSRRCQNVSYKLKGDLVIRELPPKLDNLMLQISMENPHVSSGGYFSPKLCNATESIRESVAIIIPFRDREEHLYTFLQHMHPILMRQRLEYKVYLVNQHGKDPFNRGRLINIGFVEAMKEKKWDCIIMHDVDYMPINDNNIYTCWSNPRRMIVASSQWNYQYAMPYKLFFGGVAAMTPKQFQKVNGFYNDYFGWGAEDDDLAKRIAFNGMKIDMLDEKEGVRVGRYKMLSHTKADPAKDRMEKLGRAWVNMQNNGLNNLKYNIVSKTNESLYTNLTVSFQYYKPK